MSIFCIGEIFRDAEAACFIPENHKQAQVQLQGLAEDVS